MHRLISFLSSALVLVAIPALARAQDEAQDLPAPHRHDGLFIRIAPGIAGAAATTHVDGTDYTLSGAAGRLGIGIGWSIAPRIVLDAELLGHAVLGPTLDVSGDMTEADDDVTWGVSYAGVGATYFFRNNVNLSGSVGTMIMSLDAPNMDQARTDHGVGLKLGVGKEWWLSPRWGLGAALEILGGNVPDGDAHWGVATVGLTMSATYN